MRWPEAHARRAVLEAARGPWLRGAARALSAGRSPPSPRKPGGLSSLVLGHAAALTGKSKDAGVMMLEVKWDWYADAASDTVLLSMAGNPVLMTRSHDVIRDILGSKSGSFTNGNSFRAVFGSLFPTSVIVVEDEQWRRIRGVITRAIGRLDQSGLPRSTLETCEAAVREWPRDGGARAVEVVPLLARITFDAFHRAAYGINFKMVEGHNLDLLEACMVISEAIAERSFAPFPTLWRLPTAKNRRVSAALDKVRGFVRPFMREQQAAFRQRLDNGLEQDKFSRSLLDAMVAASLEAGGKATLTDQELEDNIGTINFGAFDTTSNTSALVLMQLARHPEVQERLYAAVKDVDIAASTPKDLEEIKYLTNVLNETNRLTPIASAVPRDAREDVEVGGWTVKKGTACLLDQASMGLLPHLWGGQSDLALFRPERWSTFVPPKSVFMPVR
jgi:cytochrome P450